MYCVSLFQVDLQGRLGPREGFSRSTDQVYSLREIIVVIVIVVIGVIIVTVVIGVIVVIVVISVIVVIVYCR